MDGCELLNSARKAWWTIPLERNDSAVYLGKPSWSNVKDEIIYVYHRQFLQLLYFVRFFSFVPNNMGS